MSTIMSDKIMVDVIILYVCLSYRVGMILVKKNYPIVVIIDLPYGEVADVSC